MTVVETAAQVTFTPSNFYVPQTVELKADPNFTIPFFRTNTKPFPVLPHLLTRIRGPLEVEGGVTGADRSLQPAIMLPNERNAQLLEHRRRSRRSTSRSTRSTSSTTRASRTRSARSLERRHHRLRHGARRCPTSRPARRSASRLIVPQGISYSTIVVTHDANGHEPIDPSSTKTTIEVVNLLLGKGNDHVTITSTMVPGPDRARGEQRPGHRRRALPAARPASTRTTRRRRTAASRPSTAAATTRSRSRATSRSPATRCSGSTTPRGRTPGSPVGQLVRIARRRDVSRSPGSPATTLAARRRPRPQGDADGMTVSVIDPKTGTRARIGGDTIVVTGGADHDGRRRPDVAARALRRHVAGRQVVLEQHDDPVAPRFDDLLPLQPELARAATRSRSTRSARPTTSSTSRPRSRSPSPATTSSTRASRSRRCPAAQLGDTAPARAASPSASPPTAGRATTSSTAARPATSSPAAPATT